MITSPAALDFVFTDAPMINPAGLELALTVVLIILWLLCGVLIIGIGVGIYSYLRRFGLV